MTAAVPFVQVPSKRRGSATKNPQDDADDQGNNDARGDGEVEGEALALDADVAGQLPNPSLERRGHAKPTTMRMRPRTISHLIMSNSGRNSGGTSYAYDNDTNG
jgi:hypothetical protein